LAPLVASPAGGVLSPQKGPFQAAMAAI
jgi:hypothetical protein